MSRSDPDGYQPMEREDLDFVLAALPKGRTLFYDYADRFAVLLLSQLLARGPQSVGELKQSTLSPLLNRPVIKSLLAQLGRAQLAAQDLLNTWPPRVDAYRLTLGSWPELDVKPRRDQHQVTRQGYSLVLQLNMPVSHQRALAQTIDDWQEYTSAGYHPVARDELTLAWSRIDLDLARGEALIEEIQSDWVRDVKFLAGQDWVDDQDAWQQYYSDYLAPKAAHWPRTIMTATLWFLLEELGVRTIFFHTHDSGIALKQIRGSGPPRSIYRDLPRTFCFQSTHNGPAFLRDSQDRHLKSLFTDPATTWHVHNFSAPGDAGKRGA